uniref:Protease HtpX homolog n=1 Tax=Staphylothermus marinus TaxID=2280 RepID=A0A7C4DAU8_STAMA
MFLWLIDPFTMMAMIIAYAAGFIALMFLASLIAPKVASRLSNRFSLNASMALAMLIIIIGGLSAIYIISLIIYNVIGAYIIDLLAGLIIFLLIMNIFMYLASPVFINLMYGARQDSSLQEIVNSVASRSGMKPPKAVVVNGPPNAFAYGNFLTGRYVAVTTGMLKLVDRGELEAVIGHELGHHKHRDNAVMLLMGLFPSILYYMGIVLIRWGLITSVSRLSSRRNTGGGGLLLVLVGIVAVIFSFIMQILILAFSRLREYYADAHGARVSNPYSMQRSLAKLHLYYKSYETPRELVANSKLKTLFIYALTNTYANPYYPVRYFESESVAKIDRQKIEEIKKEKINPVQEIFSSHPPIPKRLVFLDKIAYGLERVV